MLREAHNRLRIAKNREEERAADAPSKTRAQAVGRSPTFSPCGHFWRHLLVPKGGKSAPRRKSPKHWLGIIPEKLIGKFFRTDFFLCFWLDPKAPKDQARR
ncbi:hypothetical protein, partial [Alistipes communis]|uniref:hypothetical protein n=1 Tax=Alistipes communis TaxID=2585118 RepID=UPI00266704E3